MIRRIAALIALLAICAVLIALVWAVHQHRTRSLEQQDDAVGVSSRRIINAPVYAEEDLDA
jgi:cell division protein FtsL